MAITSMGQDAPPKTTNIRPEILRIQAIYSRPRQPLGPVAALCNRDKNWVLAKWSPPWGWTNVARFATFDEANRHRQILKRSTGQEGAISHYEDGAHLRAHELLINRSRLVTAAQTDLAAVQRLRRIDRTTLEAQLWAARRGWKLTSRLHAGMVVLGLNDWPGVQ